MSIEYEVPDPLAPFVGALGPLVKSIISTDLKRFNAYALQKMKEETPTAA
jgi:hypothetical protein